MSTILKALDRLERERRPSLEQSLQEEVAAGVALDPSPPPGRSPRVWLLVGGGVALVALLVGVGFVLAGSGGGPEGPGDAPAPTLAAAPAAEAAPSPPAVTPKDAPDAKAPPEVDLRKLRRAMAKARREGTLPRPAAKPATAEAPAQPVQVARAAIPAATAEKAASKAVAPSPVPQAPVATPKPEPRPAEASSAAGNPLAGLEAKAIWRNASQAPPPKRSATPRSSAPSRAPVAKTKKVVPPSEPARSEAVAAETAPSTRSTTTARPAEPKPQATPRRASKPAPVVARRLPDFVLERTVWHPLSSRRRAFVRNVGESESRELVEGDAMGPFVVRTIEPSGVMFVNGDVEILRRVGAGN